MLINDDTIVQQEMEFDEFQDFKIKRKRKMTIQQEADFDESQEFKIKRKRKRNDVRENKRDDPALFSFSSLLNGKIIF